MQSGRFPCHKLTVLIRLPLLAGRLCYAVCPAKAHIGLKVVFGALRFYLAVVVVYVHFADFFGIGWDGIFAFFVMSGYLMTLILHKNYGYSLKGIATYGINRILRIYPMYWMTCLFAIAVLLFLNDNFPAINNATFGMPATGMDWLRNVALVIREGDNPVLVQPAWTLTVEVIYYACIGFGLSRTKTTTAVWLAGSLVYTGYLIATDAEFYYRYFHIAAASLPFSVGAAIYHWGDEIERAIETVAPRKRMLVP